MFLEIIFRFNRFLTNLTVPLLVLLDVLTKDLFCQKCKETLIAFEFIVSPRSMLSEVNDVLGYKITILVLYLFIIINLIHMVCHALFFCRAVFTYRTFKLMHFLNVLLKFFFQAKTLDTELTLVSNYVHVRIHDDLRMDNSAMSVKPPF